MIIWPLIVTCLFPSGRVARAGRSGTAYSLVCPDEMAFVYDLHLFLGRPVQLATPDHTQGRLVCNDSQFLNWTTHLHKYPLSLCGLFITFCSSPDSDGVYGRVPQSILDDEGSHLIASHESSLDLQNLHRVSENAYKQYLKSRPNPSAESIRRVKNTELFSMAVHPLLGQFSLVKKILMVMLRSCCNSIKLHLVLGSGLEKMELDRLQIVDAIKGYKSKSVSSTHKSYSGAVPC